MDANGPEAFNPKMASAELTEGQEQRIGRKLSFPQKCAAFHALSVGAWPADVAKAFGVTATTVSLLKSATRYRDSTHKTRRQRYPEVAREYQRLGAEAFRDQYYTEDVHTQLMRIKLARIGWMKEQQGDDRTPQGVNLNADKFAFKNFYAFQVGESGWWRIDMTAGDGGPVPWADGNIAGLGGPGYRFIDCDPAGNIEPGGVIPYRGMESQDTTGQKPPKPFTKSKFAYDAIFKMING